MNCWIRLLLAALIFPRVAAAQLDIPANLSGATMQVVLTNVFGTNTAFSSLADVSVMNLEGREVIGSVMGVSMLDQHFRLFQDLTNTRLAGIRLPLPAARQARLTQTANIIRFDRKVTIHTYPGVKAYHEEPLVPGTNGAESFKIRRTLLGEEPIGNDACRKEKLEMTFSDSATNSVVLHIWRAAALRYFPMQIEFQDETSLIRLRFKDPKFVRLDPKLFDVPQGYTRYKDIEELHQATR